jgi:hypothetical protein
MGKPNLPLLGLLAQPGRNLVELLEVCRAIPVDGLPALALHQHHVNFDGRKHVAPGDAFELGNGIGHEQSIAQRSSSGERPCRMTTLRSSL